MQKDFLSIADLTKEEISDIFNLTEELKHKHQRGEMYQPLQGKTLAMIFQKPSARTRVSFEVGMYQLGGHATYLAPNDIQVGRRESVADIARVLSKYNDAILARLFGHHDLLQLAEYATVPVINGLTDLLHPCQVMADLFTILEHRNNFDGLKIAYVGDGNNVANSWLNMASKVPLTLSFTIPEGYDPDKEILSMAKKMGISKIDIFRNPVEAVERADVVYTDTWVSMGKETEAQQRKKAFEKYQVDETLLSYAKKDCLVMHCLPAHRGEEITDSVIDGNHSVVFDQAENRLHVQKAILVRLMAK